VRILVVTGIFPTTPEAFRGNFVLDQAMALRDRGCLVWIAVVHPFALPGSARDRSSSINRLAFRQLNLPLRELRYFNLPRNGLGVLAAPFIYAQVAGELKNIARELRADVIHSHNEQAGYIGVRLARALGLKSGVTLHGINSPWMFDTGEKQRQLGWTLEHADRVFLVGPNIASHFRQYVTSTDNFLIVPNGHRASQNVLASQRVPRRATWRVVGVGNLFETKGYQYLIEAIAGIEHRRPGLMELVIVGGGIYERRLRHLVDELEVGHVVHMTGELEHASAMSEVAAADIFCLPSFNEAFGLVYVEAMALGKPVIGCRKQGPEAFITDGVNGFLVEPRSSEAVKDALLKIVDNPNLERVGEAGRDYAAQHLRWEHNAGKVTETYHELFEK
jgi:glycosyltransferase involved in cell wall biosynthesis